MTVVFEGVQSDYWDRFEKSLLSLFKIMLGEVDTTQDFNLLTLQKKGLAVALFVSYATTVTVLLINLLIAMMNFTFDKVQQKAHLQYTMEKASIILLIERRVTWFFRKRSGIVGRKIGMDSDYRYIVVEERLNEEHVRAANDTKGSFMRSSQAEIKHKMPALVKKAALMSKNSRAHAKQMRRKWAWPTFG
eukprot:NODE_1058_length_1031_cov_10.767699_g1013_i0.p1 GENE.NODE_1058_length_1031_cov_10.767699_g1013_i0~~NODE_1058_length_1031_cov_10.767699_g1013_i0.p1  ORF type:complete len:190 (+),score=34.13 NODE_1058_length_1031_cov_10.767699_g1013_i0:432-1001(+)